MSSPQNSLQIETGDSIYRLVFSRESDRFAHRVLQIDGAAEALLLESVEGLPDQIWPQSPALQELSIEPIAEQDVALLVGMSGKSHWSMSVAKIQTESTIGWAFDVACRIKAVPPSIGSHYQLFRQVNTKPALQIQSLNGCSLSQQSSAGSTVESPGVEPPAVESASVQAVQIKCDAELAEIPATLQWQYQISFPV